MDRLDEVFSSGHISHAYIFIGDGEDIGKKALEFSKRLLCEHSSGAPCGHCVTCRRIDQRAYTDVLEIFPEGNSIKIDQIRNYIMSSARSPREGEYKIYILHRAHTMTPQAQNALLKTLEEPTGGVITVILAENLQKLLPTVVSRCQKLDFTPHLFISSIEDSLKIPLASLFLEPGKVEARSRRDIVDQFAKGEELSRAMEFGLGLYRDALAVKTRGKTTLQNKDIEDQIHRATEALSEASIIKALDMICAQKKNVQSRGNANLIWYNLISGLQEVTKADNGSGCKV